MSLERIISITISADPIVILYIVSVIILCYRCDRISGRIVSGRCAVMPRITVNFFCAKSLRSRIEESLGKLCIDLISPIRLLEPVFDPAI